MIFYEEFLSVVSHINSLGTVRHSKIIYGLIRWLQPEIIVEVGCFVGYLTCWSAYALEQNGKGLLYTIDDWSGESVSYIEIKPTKEMLLKNLNRIGLSHRVKIVSGTSKDLCQDIQQIDLAIIDGDHTYDNVKKDCEIMLSMQCRCLVLHDIVLDGPKALYQELKKNYSNLYNFIDVEFDNGLAILLHK